MLGNFFNAVIHPVTTTLIVDWTLWRWSMDEQAQLLVVIPNNEGVDFINRFRVALSKMRKVLKQNEVDYKQFGVAMDIGKWTTIQPDGTFVENEVIYCRRFVEKHHIMTEVFRDIDFGFGKRKLR